MMKGRVGRTSGRLQHFRSRMEGMAHQREGNLQRQQVLAMSGGRDGRRGQHFEALESMRAESPSPDTRT